MNSRTIIQIDEPENGLHPMMQIQFRNYLEDIAKKSNARFIIYTHSKEIVKDGQITKGLYVITREKQISKLQSLKEYEKEKNLTTFQIFENIGFETSNKMYNLDNKKKIIIVEGQTDVIYLKKMVKLLGENYNICHTKIGGVTEINKTHTLFESVFDFKSKDIILSPDLDIKTKHKTLYNEIKEKNCFPLGNDTRPEIEGMFENKDKKYISKPKEKNTKMNKAFLFWQKITEKKHLDSKTIENFEKYFKKIKNI